MAAKREVINALKKMPETITFSEIKDTVEIIEANQRAMKDIADGKVYSTETVKKFIKKPVES